MNAPAPQLLTLKRVVTIVAIMELAFFCVEAAVAFGIGSVSLIADSIDFLEDASINFLILLALSWSLTARAKVGMLLAAILLMPTLATVWFAWQKFNTPIAPSAIPLTLTGLAALVTNATAALLLARHRDTGGSMVRAAFLTARNDMIANLGIIAAGLITLYHASAWPDLIVGIAVAALNVGAAHEVFEAARDEHRQAKSPQPNGEAA